MLHDKKDMTLRAIHFKPGVNVVYGGKYNSATCWDLVKYPDVLVEIQDSGDIWFVTPWDGRMREVKSSEVAWKLYEPPGADTSSVEPALRVQREAKKAYHDKFGKPPIKGTEQRR